MATPETTASVVYGMFDLFLAAGRDWGVVVDGTPGEPLLDAVICAERPGVVRVSNDATVTAHVSYSDCADVDVVCVPELTVSPRESIDGRFGPEIAFLLRAHEGGATIATACSGAVLLAESGLLDGEDATTHWAYCDALQKRHPSIRVLPKRALVVAGVGQRLVMAGGGTSWIDLGLFLIARLCGVDAAMQVAKLNLVDWHAVGQQPFARLARTAQVEDALIGEIQVWIAEHYEIASPVAAMVERSGMSERSFKRRFEAATGLAPLAYVHALRLEEAKQMLETTNASIESIAREVGYEDPGFFSRLFKREVDLAPAEYRRRFASLRRTLDAATPTRAGRARRSSRR